MNRSIRHPYFFSILRVDSFTKPLSSFALKRFIHNAGQQQHDKVEQRGKTPLEKVEEFDVEGDDYHEFAGADGIHSDKHFFLR